MNDTLTTQLLDLVSSEVGVRGAALALNLSRVLQLLVLHLRPRLLMLDRVTDDLLDLAAVEVGPLRARLALELEACCCSSPCCCCTGVVA